MFIQYRFAVIILCFLFIVLSYFNMAYASGIRLTYYKFIQFSMFVIIVYQIIQVNKWFKRNNKKD
ncbi:hypothetical protein V5G65_12710 [Mammaliicoccus sciuri]|uniref:hypothetical protein n=1 Tax=Mammaliicoccus sciuri TaxID=1296 RepID=UPI00379CE862